MLVAEDPRLEDPFGESDRLSALEEVANKPIAYHALDVLAAAGIEEVIVVCSSERAAAIRGSLKARGANGSPEPRLRIRYVEQSGRVHVDDALSLAAPMVGHASCVVHLAAGLLTQPLGPLISRLGRDTPDLIAMVHHASDPGWHISPSTQAMLHLAELHPERATLSMAGVCLFGPGALGPASRIPWLSPGGAEIDLTSVAAEITREGGKFEVLPVRGWCRYAGDPLDLLELNRIALDRMDHEMRGSSNDGNLIEGRVWIHEQASVRSSVIVGPAVVGPHAQIADAYIGPYTSIGPGARIEGAEIERSIIAAGASIMHVGSRLVASVVGRDARVFRDFSLPRAFRLRVGDGTEIALY